MKNRNPAEMPSERSYTIMLFGQAKLIQVAENQLVLTGGNQDDQTEAKEFISLFMHEATLSFAE